MKLHEQVKLHKEILTELNEDLANLRRYLSSAKFHDDTTVQAGDILMRLNEIENNLFTKTINFN